MKKMIAFWKYDTFPFVLGGEVTKMDDHGRVQIKTYGAGFWFRPIKFLPAKAGIALLAKLKEMTAEYQKEMKALTADHRARVRAVFGEET